jgi:hypothetical protein
VANTFSIWSPGVCSHQVSCCRYELLLAQSFNPWLRLCLKSVVLRRETLPGREKLDGEGGMRERKSIASF